MNPTPYICPTELCLGSGKDYPGLANAAAKHLALHRLRQLWQVDFTALTATAISSRASAELHGTRNYFDDKHAWEETEGTGKYTHWNERVNEQVSFIIDTASLACLFCDSDVAVYKLLIAVCRTVQE